MNESYIVGGEPSCEDGVIDVTESSGDATSNRNVNGYVDGEADEWADERAELSHMTARLKRAVHALRAHLPDTSLGSENGVACPRCGARVWIERAEHGLWILVEEDGRPHSDACPLLEGQAEVVIHPWRPFDPFAT